MKNIFQQKKPAGLFKELARLLHRAPLRIKVVLPGITATLLCSGVWAADYVTLKKFGDGSVNAYNDGNCWSDGLPPSGTKDYKVASWGSMLACDGTQTGGNTSLSNPLTFPGNSLTLGDSLNASKTGAFYCYFTGTSFYNFVRDGLFVDSGTLAIHQDISYATTHMLGRITIRGNKSCCSLIAGKYGNNWHFDGDMHSAEGAGAKISVARESEISHIYFNGDMSDYAGELEQTSPALKTHLNFPRMPGTFTFGAGTTLTIDAVDRITTVGKLRFSGDATLDLRTDANNGTNGQFIVADYISVAEGSRVHVTATDYFLRNNVDSMYYKADGTPWKSPLITAPQGTIRQDAFVFDGFKNKTGGGSGLIFENGPYRAHFELLSNGEGSETLYFVQEPIVILYGEDEGTARRDNYEMASAVTNDTRWSDGMVVHEDAHYLLNYQTAAHSYNGSAYNGILQFPQDVDDYVFPGLSLTVCGRLYVGARKSATISDLRMMDNARVFLFREGFVLNGNIEMVGSGMHYLYCTEDVQANIAANISGEGTIYLSGNSTFGTWYTGGGCEFKGDNRGYHGKWIITCDRREGYPLTNERVFLNSPNDFGAAPASFEYDSIKLSMKSSVMARKTMSLAGTTRGILVDGEAEIGAPSGVVFTVNAPITFNGTLTKTGAGVLVFGAKPRFTDGEETTLPTEGKNILAVKEGAVRADVSDAFANLAVSFENDAGIAFGARPMGELATRGIVLADASLVPAEEGVRIALSVDPTTFEGKEFTIPLFTGSRAEIDAMLAKCKFVKPAKSWGTTLSYAGSGDDVTVRAHFGPRGFVYVVR